MKIIEDDAKHMTVADVYLGGVFGAGSQLLIKMGDHFEGGGQVTHADVWDVDDLTPGTIPLGLEVTYYPNAELHLGRGVTDKVPAPPCSDTDHSELSGPEHVADRNEHRAAALTQVTLMQRAGTQVYSGAERFVFLDLRCRSVEGVRFSIFDRNGAGLVRGNMLEDVLLEVEGDCAWTYSWELVEALARSSAWDDAEIDKVISAIPKWAEIPEEGAGND